MGGGSCVPVDVDGEGDVGRRHLAHFLQDNFSPYEGSLEFGHIRSDIRLYPPPTAGVDSPASANKLCHALRQHAMHVCHAWTLAGFVRPALLRDAPQLCVLIALRRQRRRVADSLVEAHPAEATSPALGTSASI